MMDVSPVFHYFSDLTTQQQKQFRELAAVYQHWNARINLISRRDIPNLYIRHVLHSLSIAKIVTFKPGAKILDVGTGGGFPGIPLAILFPQVHFSLVDSIGKKIKILQRITQALSLKNVTTQTIRAEKVVGIYDFIVGRAVTNLESFYAWVKDKLSAYTQHEIPNGILYLTGDKPPDHRLNIHTYPLSQFFSEPFFQTKQLVHISPSVICGGASKSV